MRKIAVLLLALVLTLSMGACGGSSNVDIIENNQFVVTSQEYKEVFESHLEETIWQGQDVVFEDIQLLSNSGLYRNDVEQPCKIYFYNKLSDSSYASADDVPTSVMLQATVSISSDEWYDLWKQVFAVAIEDTAEITYEEAFELINDTYTDMTLKDESTMTIESNGVKFAISHYGSVINMEIFP